VGGERDYFCPGGKKKTFFCGDRPITGTRKRTKVEKKRKQLFSQQKRGSTQLEGGGGLRRKVNLKKKPRHGDQDSPGKKKKAKPKRGGPWVVAKG